MGKRSFPPAWVSFLLDKHYTRQANSLTTQLEISTLKCRVRTDSTPLSGSAGANHHRDCDNAEVLRDPYR